MIKISRNNFEVIIQGKKATINGQPIPRNIWHSGLGFNENAQTMTVNGHTTMKVGRNIIESNGVNVTVNGYDLDEIIAENSKNEIEEKKPRFPLFVSRKNKKHSTPTTTDDDDDDDTWGL